MKSDTPKKHPGRSNNIANDMERLFYDLFCPKNPAKSLAIHNWHPLADIIETEDKIIIKLELAGVDKNDINITLENNHLVISGVRKEILPPKIKCYHQMEINYGEFERILPLMQGTDRSSIEAKFGNGILTIIVRNKPERNSIKSVKVEVK
jgi:HSP20 family protein